MGLVPLGAPCSYLWLDIDDDDGNGAAQSIFADIVFFQVALTFVLSTEILLNCGRTTISRIFEPVYLRQVSTSSRIIKNDQKRKMPLMISVRLRSLLFLFQHFIFVPIFACQLLASAPSRGDAPSSSDYIWIEGETPSATDPANYPPPSAGGGSPDILSNGKWLAVLLDPDKIQASLPSSVLTLSYATSVSKAADYDVWMRLGYEQIRSSFDWLCDLPVDGAKAGLKRGNTPMMVKECCDGRKDRSWQKIGS
jgi:hypothetical protein